MVRLVFKTPPGVVLRDTRRHRQVELSTKLAPERGPVTSLVPPSANQSGAQPGHSGVATGSRLLLPPLESVEWTVRGAPVLPATKSLTGMASCTSAAVRMMGAKRDGVSTSTKFCPSCCCSRVMTTQPARDGLSGFSGRVRSQRGPCTPRLPSTRTRCLPGAPALRHPLVSRTNPCQQPQAPRGFPGYVPRVVPRGMARHSTTCSCLGVL